MNVLKHMEAVFLVALALAGTATWASDSHDASTAATAQAAASTRAA
jgi:hypothetical protein